MTMARCMSQSCVNIDDMLKRLFWETVYRERRSNIDEKITVEVGAHFHERRTPEIEALFPSALSGCVS
jgi:hypothetical protein